MYNLIMGYSEFRGTLTHDRMLEYTEGYLSEYFAPEGTLDPNRLLGMPTLLMPETGDASAPQIALVGSIVSLRPEGGAFRYQFQRNSAIPGISTARIEGVASQLRINNWEFSRTHWAVKDVTFTKSCSANACWRYPPPTSSGSRAFHHNLTV